MSNDNKRGSTKLVKGMFFDLDGTLCDNFESNFQAYTRALAEFGVSVTREVLIERTSNFGLRSDVFLPLVAPQLTPEQIAGVMTAKARHYADTVSLARPNRQLIDFFHVMRGHHIMVLVTSAKQVNATRVLEVTKLTGLFDHMIFGNDIEHPKPHPEAYLRALELSGLRPDQAIAFEDSSPGIASAEAAGLKVIQVIPA
ncbi:MAG: hydrolase [Patescibacteria group bacterium]|nr:hydrolase [Patescibacteria group bacterium]